MLENKIVVSEEQIFSIIAMSAEASGFLQQAFNKVVEGKYEESETLLVNAEESLNNAHKVQTEFIVNEANGNKTEFGIFMVHAQDHLMNTVLTKQLIKNMIIMQKQINELKNK